MPFESSRSHYRNGFIKQYVRDHLILRTEAATNNVTDYGVRKAVDNLPAHRSPSRPSRRPGNGPSSPYSGSHASQVPVCYRIG